LRSNLADPLSTVSRICVFILRIVFSLAILFPRVVSQIAERHESNEAQVLTFEANALNLFNRQSATGFYSQLDPAFSQSFLLPGGNFSYSAFEHPYDWKSLLSNNTGLSGTGAGVPIVGNSQYGKPFIFQTPRSMRLAVRFTF
jgi:hypothetical protein